MKQDSVPPLSQLTSINAELDRYVEMLAKRRKHFNLLGESYQKTLERYSQQGRIKKIKQYIATYDKTPWPLRIIRRVTVDIFIEQKRQVVILSVLRKQHTKISALALKAKHEKRTTPSIENIKTVQKIGNTLSKYRRQTGYFSSLRNQLRNIIVKLTNWSNNHNLPNKADVSTPHFQASDLKYTQTSNENAANSLPLPLDKQIAQDMQKLKSDYEDIKLQFQQGYRGFAEWRHTQQAIEQHSKTYKQLLLKYHPDKSDLTYTTESDKELCKNAINNLILKKRSWQTELKTLQSEIKENMAFHQMLDEQRKELQAWEQRMEKHFKNFDKQAMQFEKMLQEERQMHHEQTQAAEKFTEKTESISQSIQAINNTVDELSEAVKKHIESSPDLQKSPNQSSSASAYGGIFSAANRTTRSEKKESPSDNGQQPTQSK